MRWKDGQWLDMDRLHLGCLAYAFIQNDPREAKLCLCRYSEDVHRTECKALSIATLTRSLYATKIARVRCYTMLSAIFMCKDVQIYNKWTKFIVLELQLIDKSIFQELMMGGRMLWTD